MAPAPCSQQPSRWHQSDPSPLALAAWTGPELHLRGEVTKNLPRGADASATEREMVSRMEIAAIDFSPLGLDADWPSRRWLELIQGRGEELRGVRLGHASTHVTLNTYSHVVQGMQTKAAENVSALIFGA